MTWRLMQDWRLSGGCGLSLAMLLALAGCRAREVARRPPAASVASQPPVARAPSASVAAAESPAPEPEGRPCPKKRANPRIAPTTPGLDDVSSLVPLLDAGAKGTPHPVRLRFHHPIAGCECPSFAWSGDEESDFIYAVFPDGIPNGHRFEESKYVGATDYEMTGYFSGRRINFYEWATLQNGADDKRIGGEDEVDREAQHPEFCVEDWCYTPDPDPVLYKEVKSKAEVAKDQAEYARVLRQMKQAGAKLCPPSAR
jgi:hypothetical protein